VDHPPAPAVGRNGGTVHQNSRGTLAEGRRIQPEGLGRYAIPFPTGLSGIHSRYHRCHPSKLVIRKRATTAQRSTVRDTPPPPTRSDQQSSMRQTWWTICVISTTMPTNICGWPATGCRLRTINRPTARVTKRATGCGYIIRPTPRGGHPSFSPLGRAHTR
jgi:hypothetical protein